MMCNYSFLERQLKIKLIFWCNVEALYWYSVNLVMSSEISLYHQWLLFAINQTFTTNITIYFLFCLKSICWTVFILLFSFRWWIQCEEFADRLTFIQHISACSQIHLELDQLLPRLRNSRFYMSIICKLLLSIVCITHLFWEPWQKTGMILNSIWNYRI